MRRRKTCAAIMSALFEHSHKQLTAMFAVTDVRVKVNQAIALLGSRTMPASYLHLRREGGMWKVDTPVVMPLD
jgi:hypothetical protein